MITSNSRTTDNQDISVLLQAMTEYANKHGQRRNRPIESVGATRMELLANEAAKFIAMHHEDEGEGWSGDQWQESLSDTACDSIAALLYHYEGLDIRGVVCSWLLTFSWVEFTHRDSRWSFSGDEIALFDKEDQTFAFYAYHSLPTPTVHTVGTFIDQLSLL